MSKSIVIVDHEDEVVIPSWMAPSGWFVVGWSHEVPPGELKPLHVFGQELVLYRSESGELHCVEATCRHLGAHLGYGGRVVGDCVVCPFHGWTWGSDGTNVAVPEGKTSKRTIGVRPVCERNGIVYLWHDVAGKPPMWEMPDLFEDLRDEYPTNDYWAVDVAGGCFTYDDLPINPRLAVENIVDPLHFRYVHGTRDVPTLADHEVTDAFFMTKLRVASRGRRDDGGRKREEFVTLKQWGLGISYTRFSGRDNSHLVISVTPVDGHTVTLRQTIFLEKIAGESESERDQRMAAVSSVFPEDIVIWKHQRFIVPSSLQAEEAKIFRVLRKWARTFEPKAGKYSSEASIHAAAEGLERG